MNKKQELTKDELGEKIRTTTVIDNDDMLLLDQLNYYMKKSDNVRIAAGYFFVSGFSKVMDCFERIEQSNNKDHMIKLMISPTSNLKTIEAILAGNETYEKTHEKITVGENQEPSYEKVMLEVKQSVEYMSQNNDDEQAVNKLIKLIGNGKMQVKVYTKTRLHAKAYIMNMPGVNTEAIVGSSNFSVAGIRDHAELNLKTSHHDDAKKVGEWFNKKWNDESCVNFNKEMAEILKNSWAGKKYDAGDVYGKAALHEYKDTQESFKNITLVGESKKLYDFQIKAVASSLRKLDDYGGVIIADVVGLGKTFVGCAILKYLVEIKRAKPLVICPAHLVPMWNEYLQRFEITGKVLSRHQIGRGKEVLNQFSYCNVVLIDESHNFRNTDTNSYEELLFFLEDSLYDMKIILLTATPISNGVEDLKNQLKLFPQEKLEKIPPLVGTNLDEYFKSGTTKKKLSEKKEKISDNDAAKLRDMLRYVLIRRTRNQVMTKLPTKTTRGYSIDRAGNKMYFPKRELQHPEMYDIDIVFKEYAKIVKTISELKYARYNPGKYVKEEYKDEKKYADMIRAVTMVYGLARTSMFKRMESSVKAFKTSIDTYNDGYCRFRNLLMNGTVAIGKNFVDEIYNTFLTDVYEKINKIESEYSIEAFNVKEWIEDLNWDITRFEKISKYIGTEDNFKQHDDKFLKLVKLFDTNEYMKKEKVLLFSESAVTVKYIRDMLEKNFTDRVIVEVTSETKPKEKEMIIKRFSPDSNSKLPPDLQEIDILVSTDVLSEGVNLQKCHIVINYDFHWNPVKLIQRVGRVDRINTKHETIKVFNFLLTEKSDAKIELTERVKNRINAIRKILGQNEQILEKTEKTKTKLTDKEKEKIRPDMIEELDEIGVSAIYDPAMNNDLTDVEKNGMLDVMSNAERKAEQITGNEELLKYFENIPLGIRGIFGNKKLLIGCEAMKEILDQNNKIVETNTYRRYYSVTEDKTNDITSMEFLKQIDEIECKASNSNKSYNKFVATAWKKFNEDTINSSEDVSNLRHQKFFIERLQNINEVKLNSKIENITHFLKQKMRINTRPYTQLIELRKKIDLEMIGDTVIVDELDSIIKEYNYKPPFTTVIHKPRILYSVMVKA